MAKVAPVLIKSQFSNFDTAFNRSRSDFIIFDVEHSLEECCVPDILEPDNSDEDQFLLDRQGDNIRYLHEQRTALDCFPDHLGIYRTVLKLRV